MSAAEHEVKAGLLDLYLPALGLEPYSGADLERHQRLCTFYIQYIHTSIPPQWRLTSDHRPQYTFNPDYSIKHLKDVLYGVAEKLPVPCYHSMLGIVSTITKILDSLSKRKRGMLRSGNVESFFFIELTMWCLTTLPQQDFSEATDIKNILKKVRSYCTAVKDQVLISEKPERNNPVLALEEVLTNLRGIYKGVTGELPSLLDGEIATLHYATLNIASYLFHMMRHLIKGDHTYEPVLPVSVFLDDNQTHRPKIADFKKQRLAIWLLATFNALGINRNDFIGKNPAPSWEKMDAHLRKERPLKAAQRSSLPVALYNPLHQDWGHWPCLVNKLTSAEGLELLKDIRNIHRHALRLYGLQSILSQVPTPEPMEDAARSRNPMQGESVLRALLFVARDILTSTCQSITSFWETCDRNRKQAEKLTPNEEASLLVAEQYYQHLKSAIQKTEECINRLQEKSKFFQQELWRSRRDIQPLLTSLITYFEHYKQQTSSEYIALKEAELFFSTDPSFSSLQHRNSSATPEDGFTTSVEEAMIEENNVPKAGIDLYLVAGGGSKPRRSISLSDRSHSPLASLSTPISPISRTKSQGAIPIPSILLSPPKTGIQTPRSVSFSEDEDICYFESELNNDSYTACYEDGGLHSLLLPPSRSFLARRPLTYGMPNTNHSQYIYKISELSVAHEVQRIVRGVQVSMLNDYLDIDMRVFEHALHRQLYEQILLPYKMLVQSKLRAFFSGYLGKSWEQLQEFYARLAHAMLVIRDSLYPLKSTTDSQYELQLELINICLFTTIAEMSEMLPQNKGARTLLHSAAKEFGLVVMTEPLKPCPNQRVEVMAKTIRLLAAEVEIKCQWERINQLEDQVRYLLSKSNTSSQREGYEYAASSSHAFFSRHQHMDTACVLEEPRESARYKRK